MKDIIKKDVFIAQVAEQAGLTKKETERAVETVFAVVSELLASGKRIQIGGFGTFETRQRAARTGHNPRTGEALLLSSSLLPVFRPSQLLKDRVNQKNS